MSNWGVRGGGVSDDVTGFPTKKALICWRSVLNRVQMEWHGVWDLPPNSLGSREEGRVGRETGLAMCEELLTTKDRHVRRFPLPSNPVVWKRLPGYLS